MAKWQDIDESKWQDVEETPPGQIPGSLPTPKYVDKTTGPDRVNGVLEAAAFAGSGLFAAIGSPLYGLYNTARYGGSAEKNIADAMEAATYKPRTEKGEDYASIIGDITNRYLTPLTGIHLPAGANPKAKWGQEVRKLSQEITDAKAAELKAKQQAPQPTVKPAVDPGAQAFDNIVGQQVGGWTEPNPNFPRGSGNGIDAVLQQVEAARQAKAQNAPISGDPINGWNMGVEARQRALEEQVRRQTLLDQNAAERARQEAAPTGYQEWVDAQRQSAEQRMPGNNEPMNMESPYPVDVNEFPQALQDAPYQHQNMLEYDMPMVEKSLPIDVIDSLGNVTPPDPFNRYSPNQAARRILIEGEHPPINKTFDPVAETAARNAGLKLSKGRKGNSQGGAIDPEMLKAGFRGVNRALSKLTDQAWVKKTFPASHFQTNPDGTPMVLLHGTNKAFYDTPRGVSQEGLHAGYAGAANMKAGGYSTSSFDKSRFRIGNVPFESDSAVYPVVIRKGNYPTAPRDFGTWSPTMLANNSDFALTLSKATEGRVGFHDAKEILGSWFDNNIGQNRWRDGLDDAELNRSFAQMLKSQFDVDGFFYKNTYESAKAKLMARAGEMPVPQKARNLAEKLNHETSIVTWNDNNIVSMFDNSVPTRKPSNLNKFGQGGGISEQVFKDAVDFAKNLANISNYMFTPRKVKDSVVTPVSEAMIAQRNDLAQKEQAGGLTSQYQRITTKEQALSMIDPKTDLTAAGGNSLRSGSEAVLRTNPRNAVVNFIRTSFQDARNAAEVKSKKFVTNGQDGMVTLVRKLSQEEKEGLADVLLAADKQQLPLDEAAFREFGLNDSQVNAGLAIRKALDERYAGAMEAAHGAGYEGFKYRAGYIPSMFSGAYATLVGEKINGRFVTRGIAQGDTRWQHKAALQKYEEMGYTEHIPLDYKGLKETSGMNRMFDGFAQVVAQVAKFDPQFAEAYQIATQAGKDQVRALYRFDVHELKKVGISGNLGNRPWLTRAENTKQLFEAITNYVEEGFRYDAMQGPLMHANDLAAHPDVQAQMPNTAKWIQKYTDNIRGGKLNAVGAFGNATINLAMQMTGLSPQVAKNAFSTWQSISTTKMMGMFNTGFFAMQLTQPITGAAPEAVRLRAALGLDVSEVGAAMTNAAKSTSIIAAAEMAKKITGKDFNLAQIVEPHMAEAYTWARDHGMFDFSEAELAHEISTSKAKKAVKDVANSSINYAEKMTRPPVFMWYADMFHKAGFRGEEAYLRAQAATDYAMTNYHPDERPRVYNELGELGKMVGALSTYKHNFIEQQVSSLANVKNEPAAAVMGIAAMLSIYGVAGMPGYQDLDTVVRWLTGLVNKPKSIREMVLDNPEQPNAWMEGLASWYSGYDIQARVSTSQIFPDVTRPTTLAPHLKSFLDIAGDSITYAKNLDQASLNGLIESTLPTSMKNVYETKVMTDEKGFVYDAEGNRKTEQPRTEAESSVRSGLGVRPVRERIQDETLWGRKYRLQQNEKKLGEITTNFNNAIRLGDIESAKRFSDKYKEKGGDPQVLWSNAAIEKTLKEKQLSPKQRAEGIPNNSVSSVRKWQTIEGVD